MLTRSKPNLRSLLAHTKTSLTNLEMELYPPPIRQPPPPLRRQSSGSPMDGLTDSQLNTSKRSEEEGEGNSLIDVPKKRVKVKNGRSHPYHLRRCKRLNFLKANINSLPDEIVFEILVRIPAEDIFGAVRPVCLKWYQMIHTHKFVNTHLHRSTYGLLIQNQEPLKTQLTFTALSREGRIELTRLNYVPGFELWCSSCDGLILESERRNHYALYITNPVTMQHFSLPPSRSPIYGMGFLNSAIAYASLSMEYKVVRVYYWENQYCLAISTVGVDESWRPVRTQHLSLEAKKLFTLKPLTTEGFVHWAKWANYVLTLNVETEIITEYLVPSLQSRDRFGCNYYYLSTVKYLSLLIRCQGWSWEVWEMKPETGEWKNLPGLDLNDRKCEILEWFCKRDRIFKSVGYSDSTLNAVGWLEYGEVLVICVFCPVEKPRVCIAWNVRSQEIEFIELDSNRNDFFVHRNSLLWLDEC